MDDVTLDSVGSSKFMHLYNTVQLFYSSLNKSGNKFYHLEIEAVYQGYTSTISLLPKTFSHNFMVSFHRSMSIVSVAAGTC